MKCFGTTDFDNNSRLITLSVIIISGLHCINIYIYICINIPLKLYIRWFSVTLCLISILLAVMFVSYDSFCSLYVCNLK